MKAAIYHFTDTSEKRPIVNEKQLHRLENFATSLGYTDIEIFCDKSLLKSEHPKFDKLMLSIREFDALITKDFYHISKNTLPCIGIIQELRNKGIPIYTIENGSLCWENAPFDKPLKVATYCYQSGTLNKMKKNCSVYSDILNLFADKKTNWTITDQYFDENEPLQLMRLLQNKDKYDLILVHTLNDIHYRTANFCKIREQYQLNIYSLQEGFLPYKGVIKHDICR